MKRKTAKCKTLQSGDSMPHHRTINPPSLVVEEPELIMARHQSLRIKAILVPIDFSDESRKALVYAARFAEDHGAKLHLLHVIEAPPFAIEMPHSMLKIHDQEFTDQARARLADLAREALDEFIPASPEVRIGRPYQEIVAVAKTLRTDLIIISTHGYAGVKQEFLGSTAERVLRYAPCPVLIVRQKEHEFI